MDSRSSGKYLGMVVGGSLSRGVDVRLDTQAQVEEMALGQHVVIHGKSRRFFGVITDIALESSDESLRGSPPDLSNPIVAQVVADTATFATLRVLPMLALEGVLAAVDGPTPAKTVPPHFAPVHLASEEDVQMVFGAEDNRHFWVGNPLDMETRVCLDLEEFVKRSNGVFRQERHRKELPYKAAAGGHSSEERGREPGVRHGERVRLDGHVRGRGHGQGYQAAVPVPGVRILPGR